jgi:hypothetical protein
MRTGHADIPSHVIECRRITLVLPAVAGQAIHLVDSARPHELGRGSSILRSVLKTGSRWLPRWGHEVDAFAGGLFRQS